MKKERFCIIDSELVIAEIRKELSKEFSRYNSHPTSKNARKQLLGTLFLNLYELKDLEENFEPFELVGIEQTINRISSELTQYAYEHFFGNLYQIRNSLREKDYERLQNQLHWTINDLYSMHAQILQKNIISNSLESSFFGRLKGLVAVDHILIDRKDEDFFILSLINLCTLNTVLVDYIHMNGDFKDEAIHYLKSSFETLKKAFLDTEKDKNNVSLFLYVYINIKKDLKILNEDVDTIEDEFKDLMGIYESNFLELRDYASVLGLCNLYELDKEKFKEMFNLVFDKLSTKKIHWNTRPFYIKLLILYLKELELFDTIHLGIKPYFNPLNTIEVLNKMFPEYSAHTEDIEISDEDKEKLMEYDDSKIRAKLATILLRSDYIEEMTKKKLEMESKKPHTGFEISDFEISIEKGLSREIQVCMPIKSAREIRRASVPENYAYQIMKPFIHLYDQCVVIFVTSKKCSQSLNNYILKLNTMYKFPIDTLEEMNLCKLFKFYGQLD